MINTQSVTRTEPPKPPAGRWVLMGEACVDSGTLAVIDPCYVIGPDRGTRAHKELSDRDWDKNFWPYCNDLGVTFSSGYGDGSYEVWGLITDDDRVAEVRVCMISEGEEGDDE